MYQIIQEIFQWPLKNTLALKWGTLCFFVHGLERFSTDLDFDIVEENKNIEPICREILKKYGKIKDEYNKANTLFFLLDYGEHHKNIKIEISKKRSSYDTYETINFFWIDVKAMSKECLFANKLLALWRRYKNRDLFDVRFFFRNHFPINTKIIEEEAKCSYKKYFQKLIKEIPKEYNEKTLPAEIGDLLTEKQKYFVKHNLVKEVLWYLQFYISKVK